jgi:hypothetical protein
MPLSPISGTAVGTARPFRDIRLPFLSAYDLDTVLTVLQTDLTTVGVEGTVKDPALRPLAFTDLGQGMRMFIFGDVSRRNAGGAGGDRGLFRPHVGLTLSGEEDANVQATLDSHGASSLAG